MNATENKGAMATLDHIYWFLIVQEIYGIANLHSLERGCYQGRLHLVLRKLRHPE
jgi:hypothetical protein